MDETPLVSIIIPHYNGLEILLRCLESVVVSSQNRGGQNIGLDSRLRGNDASESSASYTDFPNPEVTSEIILVDNASTDGSGEIAKGKFPEIRWLQSEENLGFAGGCNFGMKAARGKYVVLLNNDAVVTPGWLEAMVEVVEADENVAAVQPKIRSLVNHGYFDYAGAAGGMLDVWGFPFARGRMFFTAEEDLGQFDEGCEIFWASGTCTLLRKSAVEQVGFLDETFFAHMEEIDLDWRLHLAGYEIKAQPAATVFHNAGSTLKPDSPRKVFLNHRNNLIMLLKNYQIFTLLWIMPVRVVFECMALGFALMKGNFRQVGAIFSAFFASFKLTKHILVERKRVARFRKISDKTLMKKMYRGSIVLQYFVFGKKTFESLNIAPIDDQN